MQSLQGRILLNNTYNYICIQNQKPADEKGLNLQKYLDLILKDLEFDRKGLANG